MSQEEVIAEIESAFDCTPLSEDVDGPVLEVLEDGTREEFGKVSKNLMLFDAADNREALASLIISGDQDASENVIFYLSPLPAKEIRKSHIHAHDKAVQQFSVYNRAEKAAILHWLEHRKSLYEVNECDSILLQAVTFWQELVEAEPEDKPARPSAQERRRTKHKKA